ncbi:DUF3466 family protein [Aliikangiella marina]|uniref:DUF3466 family protein n=1 Tax=Aliikangiella marina TaxID=1712262 RepID=A0A545T2U8_9GAMM|nr:DUF3466 family protein [Aliikangiella marina]TQV71529.1 DUF3466 family protein [Aliikangiella marina]
MINLKKSLLAGAIAACSLSAAAVETAYNIVPLGTFEDNEIFAFGINNNDVAVGYSYVTGGFPSRGYAYDNGTFTNMGSIVNQELAIGFIAATIDESVAFDINDNGMMIGYSVESVPQFDENNDPVTVTVDQGLDTERELQSGLPVQRAIYTQVGSQVLSQVPLFEPEQDHGVRALAVNNNGVIVGFAELDVDDDLTAEGEDAEFIVNRGVIYDTQTDTLTRVNPLNYDNLPRSIALKDINDNGVAVGWSQVAFESSFLFNGVVVNAASPETLTTIDPGEETASLFNAINNNGMVAGKLYDLEKQRYEGIMFNSNNGAFEIIPPLVEGLDSQICCDNASPYDINAQNIIVGSMIADVVPDTYHAFAYQNGTTYDLNDLIDCTQTLTTGVRDWVLYEARQINDNGIIIGNGLFGGERKAFMLTPNPGATPTQCDFEQEEEDSGSGSIPASLIVLLSCLAVIRRKVS